MVPGTVVKTLRPTHFSRLKEKQDDNNVTAAEHSSSLEGYNHMTCRCTAEFYMLCGLRWRTFNYETVEADRLAHMRVRGHIRVPGDIGIGGARPPLFPQNMPDAFAAFFPPSRPMVQQQANMMANQARISAFLLFHHIGANFNTFQDEVQEKAQQRRKRLRQQSQDLHDPQLFNERQQRLRAVEVFARNMRNLNMNTDRPATAPRRRRC